VRPEEINAHSPVAAGTQFAAQTSTASFSRAAATTQWRNRDEWRKDR
jgi:hypothetical protein